MKYLLILLVLVFLFLGIVSYIIWNLFYKVEIREIVSLPKISRENYINIDFIYQEFRNTSRDFVFGILLENKFQEKMNIDIFSWLEITEGDKKILISNTSIVDYILSGLKKRYDLRFQDVFDDSKIKGVNFCETFRNNDSYCKYECCADDKIDDAICWIDCKIYTLSFYERKKNLYCRANSVIYTFINYSTSISGIVEIDIESNEDRIKWNILRTPVTIYIRPSPVPYNNLLPLNLAIEIVGEEDVFIRDISIEIVNYTIESETYFSKKREIIGSREKCKIEVNDWIRGKIYLTGENGCTFNQIEVVVEKISNNNINREKIVNIEKINEILRNVCKEYVVDNKIEYEECAKKLNKMNYNICSLYSDLDICKIGNEARKIILLIKVNFDKIEKFKKDVIPTFC